MIQDMAAGRGFGMIDVHGDLYDHMKWYLARLSLAQPELGLVMLGIGFGGLHIGAGLDITWRHGG